MASSLSISRASSVMASILDRSIDIPRDISFRGDFTLVNKSGGSETVLKQSDLSKLTQVSSGVVSSNKTLIVNSDKNINGINEQTNTGKLTFDVVKNDDEGAVDLVFSRARGNRQSKTETYHRNHIGVISYEAYVNGDYIDTAGIDVNTYKKSYSNNYIGSEILFSNTGGSDINSGKHDSLKIDATGNTNILKSRELRLNTSRYTNYSSFRPAINTQSPGYTMELPATKGTVGDVLRINSVGYGGVIRMSSNDQGVITEAIIYNRGQGYDPNYIPEVRTEVNMTGGKLRENGNAGGNTDINDSTIILSSNAKGIQDYYRGWIIETINPSFKRIIHEYNSSDKTAIVSSVFKQPITTLTQYKLSEGHFSGSMNINNDEEITIRVTILFDEEKDNYIVDNYFQNWTIYVDINSNLYQGTITSSTANIITGYPTTEGVDNVIVVNWSDEIPSGPHINRIFSLSNNTIIPASIQITNLDSNGEIDSIELHDGGRGYIPLVTIDVPISSQNKLEWSKMTLEGWGLDKVEGTCTGEGFTGSTTEFSYIQINQTASLIDDGSSPLVSQISNGSWTVELTNKDSSITSWSKFYGVVRHYDNINGRLYINTGNSPTENSIPLTNTTTIYKLVKYPESGFTGTYSNYSLLLGHNSADTENPRYPESSNINNHYQGWLFISYGYGIYDIDDSFTGVITNYDSSTKNAHVVLSNNNNGSFSGPSTYILSNTRPYGTSLKVGPGLTGGGNLANNVSVELDLSTHDINADTSNYSLEPQDDKILIYSNSDENTKMPTMTNFLSSILGIGLTLDTNGLIVNNAEQSIILNTSENFKVYSKSGQHSSHYINIGKDDNENLNITNEYDLSNNLKKTIIKTQSNQTGRDTSIQFNIQDGVDALTINDDGISVKKGIIESITIINSGGGYTSPPEITFSPSPFGENFTATATCTINSNGQVDSITITNNGLGYSSSTLPDITLTENPLGTSAILSPVVNDSRYITGQINNDNIEFDGYFRNLTTGGNVYFKGDTEYSIMSWDRNENSLIFRIPNSNNNGYDSNKYLFIKQTSLQSIVQSKGTPLYLYSQTGELTLDTQTSFLDFKSGLGIYNFKKGEDECLSIDTSTIDSVKFKSQQVNADMEFVGLDSNGTKSMIKMKDTTSIDFIGGSSSGGVTINNSGDIITSGTLDAQGGVINFNNGGVINFDSGDITITHSSNTLTFDGNIVTTGTHEVQGGEIKIWCIGGSESGHYKLNFPKGNTTINSNIQLTNKNRGIPSSSVDTNHYANTMIGMNMPTNPGHSNTLVGRSAGSSLSQLNGADGEGNTFIGNFAGNLGAQGNYNVAVGFEAGKQLKGDYNVCIGKQAGYRLETASENVVIGSDAGYYLTGDYNVFIGKEAGKWLRDSYNNICIGYQTGPSPYADDSNLLFIDTLGNYKGEDSLIYGDQGGSTNLLNFNAEVTISGTLEVQGGEIFFYGKAKANTISQGSIWKIYSPGSPSGNDTNLVISNDSYGLESADAYDDTIVIGNLSKGRGSRSTIIGGSAGRGINSHQDDNTFIGYGSGSYGTSGVKYNTFIGSQSGKGISGDYNICIGYNTGYSSDSSLTNALIIDCRGSASPLGTNSLIYGNQSGDNQDLILNANVVISNNVADCGNLNVKGGLNVEGNLTVNELVGPITATSLTLEDINIDVNPSVGRTNFNYNLFFTSNSHNVDFTVMEYNTFFGTYGKHLSITKGAIGNSAFGYHNLVDLTTGDDNTSIGLGNMIFLTNGHSNVAVGSNNLKGSSSTSYNNCVAIGKYNFLDGPSTGIHNIGIGYNNCEFISGSYNVAIGKDCLKGTSNTRNVNYSICIGAESGKNITNNYNILIGRDCGKSISGTQNVGVGTYALRYRNSGSNNIGIGFSACRGLSGVTNNGEHNIALGYTALTSVSSGKNNVSIGVESGNLTTTGNNNTFLGPYTGVNNISGDDNISIGYSAGEYLSSGHRNICIGSLAGPQENSAVTNDRLYIDNSNRGDTSLIYGDMSSRIVNINGTFTVIGDFIYSGTLSNSVTIPSNGTLSLTSINNVNITSEHSSMYLGYESGNGIKSDTTLSGNTFYGFKTGFTSTVGLGYNTFIGYEAGYFNTIGNTNVCVGARTCYKNQKGVRNVCIGHYAGYYVEGSYTTCIGSMAGPTAPDEAKGRLYIDPVTRRGDASLIYGEYGEFLAPDEKRKLYFNAEVKILYDLYVRGVYRYSDVSLKKDIVDMDDNITEKINLLRPVSYTLKSSENKDVGFIAQDVHKIFPLLINKEPKKGLLSIDYSKLTSYLVKGLQETNHKVRELEEKLKKEKDEREKMKEFFLEEIKKLRDEIKKE